MAVTIKKAILWRREVDNSPGMLASILQPLSEATADLQVVMAYRYPEFALPPGGFDSACST